MIPAAHRHRILQDGEEGLPADFGADVRLDRDIQHFLGIAKGILLDKHVDDAEAESLLEWCEAHPEVVVRWPANKVYGCLHSIFDDGVVDERERKELTALLENVTGGAIGPKETPTSLPFDDPLPELHFADRVFVFTGRFAFGPRTTCWSETEKMGGIPQKRITFKTDYLVIGTLASQNWKHGAFGRKIQKAVHYRAQSGRPAIITEDHWAAPL
ncbi:MAG: BRCT domain-containing protein [Gammaproteobacteria bacterium]|nr:BRCT domain-containing protein [Gammaproteobacteria bacterium]MDE0258068.1 BRCT domain-containing protein [Gammaproteobacteria bacterium]